MKRVIGILLIVLLCSNFVFAQDYATDKGSIMIGGTAGFTSTGGDLYENMNGDGTTTIYLYPGLLYFISPGIGVGADLSFMSRTRGDEKESGFGGGPKVGYYMGGAGKSLIPFISANLLFTSNKYENSPASKWTEMTIGFQAGALFKVNDFAAIQVNGWYDMDSFKADGADESMKGSAFGVAVGIAVFAK